MINSPLRRRRRRRICVPDRNYTQKDIALLPRRPKVFGHHHQTETRVERQKNPFSLFFFSYSIYESTDPLRHSLTPPSFKSYTLYHTRGHLPHTASAPSIDPGLHTNALSTCPIHRPLDPPFASKKKIPRYDDFVFPGVQKVSFAADMAVYRPNQ